MNENNIESILARLDELERRLLWSDAEKLLTEAVGSYPDNEDLKVRLINVWFQLIRRNHPDSRRTEAAVKLGEELVSSSESYELINNVNRLLCFITALDGDKASAKKYYDRLPSIESSRELYAAYVMDGDELKEQLQRNIETYMTGAVTSARQLAFREKGDRGIKLLEKTIELYELLYEGDTCGPYLSDMAIAALDIASYKAKQGDTDGAIDSLSRAVGYAERYEAQEDDASHSSILVDRIAPKKSYAGAKVGEIIRNSLTTKDNFDLVRRDPRIGDILTRLKKL